MRLRPASILLIDHDPEIADRLRQLQPADNRYSYTLEFADNLEVGLQRLAGGGFDLLILGLSLPEAPGLEACQRARGQALDVPLVVLTDRAGESTAVMAVENGAQDYLVKEQLQPDLLVRVIRNVMAYGQAQEALRKAYGELEERTLELERTNAHLRQNIAEHEQIEQYLATIYQLGWELAKLRSDSDIARRVLEIAQQEFGIERASLALVDNVSNQLEYRYRMVDGLVEPFQLCLPLGARNARGIGTFVAKSGQLLNVSDTAGDPRYVPDPEGWSGRSELCVPMRLGQRIIGVLNAESLELDRFTLVDQQLFQALADQTAVALENVRLYRETQNRERELAGLNQAGRTMASTLNLDAVLQQVMAEAKTTLTAEGVAVLLTEPAIDELVFAAVASPSAEIMIGTQVPLESSIAGWVVREKKPTLIRDAQRDERFYDHIDSITGLTTHSVLAVPLIFGGKVTGVIEATNKVTGSFNLHDLGLLEALASSAAIAIENARLYQELQDKMLALQEAQIQLVQQEKMAALGRLSSSITHEINNPLQAIQNSLALLEDEVGDEQRTKKLDQYLGIARDEIDRISAIMYRMRSFYSGVYGQRLRETADSDTIDDFYRSTNQELQSIDLHQLLEHILQLVGNQLEDKAVTVERKWAVDMPVICGNPDHLKQVFLNLMLNAIDAMSGTGGTLYLSTELDLVQPDESQPQQVALVEFSDTGVGISPENLSQVFEPFFSTKEAGSGLGLSICYKIIRAHEGQIGVESQLGLGTTFTVKLPVSSAEG